MFSLSDLNNYSQTIITFSDDRPFEVIFDLNTPLDVAQTVFENQSPTLQTGIEIIDIVDPETCDVVYEIDMTTVGVDVELDFGTVPANVTITESPTKFWTVSGINSVFDWNAVKSPTVTFAFGTVGTATFSTTIEHTLADSSRGTKDTDYTVTIEEVSYMSAPTDQEYSAYEQDFTPDSLPSITVDTGVFNPTFTMTISPDTLNPINSMSVTQPDSAVFTTSTDTLVINGEKDEINSALATLEIDFSGVNESFDLTYSLTNNLNSDVDIVVQEFASFEFAAVVENTFTMTGGITQVITASASDTIGSFVVETSFNNKFAEAAPTMTASVTANPDGIQKSGATANVNTFSATAAGNTPITWTFSDSLAPRTVSILQTGASDNELYVNIPGITSGNTLVTLQGGYLEIDTPDTASYNVQIMSVDGSDITDYVRILSNPSVTSVNSFGELTNGTNVFSGHSGTSITSLPDRLNADMTNLNSMFENSFTGSSVNIPGNISNWDTSNITNMGEMFKDCGVSASTIPSITSWDVSNMRIMRNMFEGSTFNQNIGSWDTGSVTDMQEMFKDATNFNYSLNSWDMANVTTINSMFAGATSYNQPVNSWTLTDLTNMESLFAGATAFNSNPNFTLPAAVTSLASVFFNATSFNQPVTWNVSNITSFSSLFNNADSFNQDISAWSIKTSGNVEFGGMFANNGGFNNGSLNSWNTVGVTAMGFMFNNSIFNQDISGWDTSNVIIMNSMFKDNTAFDQDISGWDVDSVALSTDFDTNTNVNWTSAEKPTFT